MDPKDMTPNAADITAEALKYIERELWCASNHSEDEDAQHCWLALLYDAEGDFLTGGQGSTACRAAAVAWLWTWADMPPFGDEPWDGAMPESRPDDYRFELFPPGTWETGSLEWDQAWPGADAADQRPPPSWVERRREALQRGL
jgi:hypothetical protein